jgi:uncharacterized OB-fold protein
MTWTLISFSEIMVPLEPLEGSYIIGIVENSDFERKMVQIDTRWKNDLKIGMPGDVTPLQKNAIMINTFQPIKI